MNDGNDFLQNLQTNMNPNEFSLLKSIIDYNHTGGKNIRSNLYKKALEYNNYVEDSILADCIEILQTSFLILDDAMDNSTMRRNKLCWYLKKGLNAINHANLLISSIYKTIQLKEICDDKKHTLLRIFNDVIFMTCIGQTEDIQSYEIETWDDVKKNINRKNYESICAKKTGYYTFYLPLKLAMNQMQIIEPVQLKELCNLFGLYYQVYDDFIDFFPEKSGKTGFDINDRKLTWLMCRIVEEGYNQQVINYFKGDFTDKIKEMAFKKTKYINDEIKSIDCRIMEISSNEIQWIIELFYEIVRKHIN